MVGDSSLHCCYREQFAYALYAKFRQPKLYRMAENGDWDRIPARCSSHPKEAAFVHKYPPNDTALHRRLSPLSNANSCSSNEENVFDNMDDDVAVQQMLHWKMEAVIALINAYPSCINVRDSFGRNPLHLACMDMKGGGDVAAQYLLDLTLTATPTTRPSSSSNSTQNNNTKNNQNKNNDDNNNNNNNNSTKSLAVDDNISSTTCLACVMDVVEKRTPLHYLVARNTNVPMNIVNALLLQYPQAIHIQDITGETPLDIIHRRQDEIQNVDELLTKFNSYTTTSSSSSTT